MACDAASLIAKAVANGYNSCDDRMLRVAIVEAACEGGAGAGAGAGSGAVLSGHYGGVAPAAPPATPGSAAINYDLDAPFREWKWDGAAWT